MDCHDATGRFSDLRDARLRGGELVELQQHLAGCPACRQEWAEFSRAIDALRSLDPVQPGPGFAARIREQIEATPWYRRLARWLFIPWRVKLPLEAAALVLLAIGTVFVYQHSLEMRQAVEQARAPATPLSTVKEQREVARAKRPEPLEAERVPSKPEGPPSTGEAPKARADHALPRAYSGLDRLMDSTASRQDSPTGGFVAGRSRPRAPMQDLHGTVTQPPPEPVAEEARPAERREPEGAARPLAALALRPELTPFRIMTLRTPDVAAAEERIRRWTGLVGGRSLDQPVAAEATPAGERVLALVVPLKAVPSLDVLLAELGQLFGKELDVPRSDEVLISLTITPKPPRQPDSE